MARQYKLNALQFHSLTAILHETKKSIGKAIGLTEATVGRHLEDGDFKVQELIALCNTFRLPLSAFITADEDPSFRGLEQEDEDTYEVVAFSAEKVFDRINVRQTSFQQMSRATGFARNTLDTILGGRCQISKLLQYCNAMRYNLSDFILGCESLACIIDEVNDVKAQNARIRTENRKLRKQIADGKRQIAELKAQLAAQNALVEELRSQHLQVAEETTINYEL